MADQFAEIAKNKQNIRQEFLSENPPMAFEKRVCSLGKAAQEKIAPMPEMKTTEELYQALQEKRQAVQPFLQNYAPEIPMLTKTVSIEGFLKNDAEKITLPDYGGPAGNAESKYEAVFELEEELTDKAVYICFGGADYLAEIYVNDRLAGQHEGFFSPFEFEITDFVRKGSNSLRVILKNDYIYMGNVSVCDGNITEDGKRIFGDKMYAATGLGWDDPESGWHHCPPGMGIYNYVRVEIRNRLNITDVYVLPMPEEKKAEVWVEVENADYLEKLPVFSLAVYGQNFKKSVLEGQTFEPYFDYDKKQVVDVAQRGNDTYAMYASHGRNFYKIPIDFDEVILWDLDTPYLYQVQVTLLHEGAVCDVKKQQFGMRSFVQDTESTPKGFLYLNGRQIRLRGANTMGFEQQDVLRGDYGQLIDDILLTKLCNMNFWRLTQRPVQDEVYEYCDKLGLMTQTDLPLFNVMRRNKYAEMLRQTEEMIKLVRRHPCNIMVSYVNEPTAFGWVKPHRNLLREEMEEWFAAADNLIHMHAPGYVIKHIDGDYDAPTQNSSADNHCYNLWYNGHSIDFGKMYRGYWVDTNREWCCACGEYGAEGLDFKDLMERRYPAKWLKEPFNPANIKGAQAMDMHGVFFDTPGSLEEWVSETQKHQAFAAKFMTECFRRRPEMISNAIHLFIDAWPAGWMKAIMDCERRPKQAYFAYREALAPALITLRSDRFTYFEGEPISIETYISNDLDKAPEKCEVVYELYKGTEHVKSGRVSTGVKPCDVTYAANAEFVIDKVQDREKFTLKAFLLDATGAVLSENAFSFEVFADVDVKENDTIVYIDDLEIGEHEIAGETIRVHRLTMGKSHFVSRATGHSAVAEFEKNDFKYWYNREQDMITPITDRTFTAEGFRGILQCNNKNEDCRTNQPEPQFVVAEKLHQGKRYIISTLDLRCENPVAKRFKKALYELD